MFDSLKTTLTKEPNILLAQIGGETQGLLTSILMMVGVFAIFYFLLIRPQQKRQKDLKKQIGELSKGDRFVTTGGIYGKVIGIKENVITAQIAENVKVEIAKSAISAIVEKN